MALSHESNTSLAFNTTTFRQYGAKYGQIATELRNMAKKLNGCLADLDSKTSGWTTPAGSAFKKLVETNWEENIDKYADLLDTLKDILDAAAREYDGLVSNHIEKTQL